MVARLVSGGQTGADRAALDVGRRLGIPIGGWCPAGGWAEDLPEPPGLLAVYPELHETGSSHPNERTELNVRDSDATLVIVAPGIQSPGTALTIEILRRLDRTHLIITPDQIEDTKTWLAALPENAILNVAGPRESQAPGHYDACTKILFTALA